GTATITAVSTFNTSKKGAAAVTVVAPTPIVPPTPIEPPTPIVPPVQPDDNTNIAEIENNFWISVVALIQSAQKGDMLKIDAGAYTKMPACVMEELRIKGAGLVITWNGGKDIVIPAGKAPDAEKDRDVWTLAELSKIYNKYSLGNKKSPNTGVDSYEIAEDQTGQYILVMVIGALVAAVVVFGVYTRSRKKKQEEE
ncbi:MAG: hypothetical protein RSA41_06805, partial [Christensenella sp.]